MTGEPITKEAWKDAWREARRYLREYASEAQPTIRHALSWELGIVQMENALWSLRRTDDYNARMYKAVAYAAGRPFDWLNLPLRARVEIRGQWPHLAALLRIACRAGVA